MAALAVVLGGFMVWRLLDSLLFGGGGAPGAVVTVRIPQGSSIGGIGDVLDAAGVVDNGGAWALKVRLSGDGGSFQPGTYRLRRNEDYDTLVAALSRGPAAPVAAPVARLVVPEGLRLSEIAQRASQVGISPAAYRAAVRAAGPPAGYRPTANQRLTMEGFLFPATYELRRPVTAKRLVAEQLAAFRDAQARVDFTRAAKANLTRYDVLIIASLVEREAAFPGDRAKIAAVIWNRLREGMSLGIDATLQYPNGSWRPLTAADLEKPGPYNSRLTPGLPPTPIANPGLASMRAAANPAKTDALYFVAIPGDPKRRHYFTASLDDFNRYQQEHPAG